MSKRYRIEIDVRVDDGFDIEIIDVARIQYQSQHQAWNEQGVPVGEDEFIQDIESALLELIEAGFREAVPHAEPHAFRCVLISEGTGPLSEQEESLTKRHRNIDVPKTRSD